MHCSELITAFRQQAREFTQELRHGNDPFMQRLREILRQRQLDPEKTACVGAYDDLLDNYNGFIVLQDGRAIEFSLDFSEGSERAAPLVGWEPVNYSHGLIADRIAVGCELLAREGCTITTSFLRTPVPAPGELLMATIEPNPQFRRIPWPTSQVLVNGRIFTDIGEGDRNGSYSFLRRSDGQIAGLEYHPPLHLGLFEFLPSGPGLKVTGYMPVSTLKVFFEGHSTYDPIKSNDREEEYSYIFKSHCDVFAFTFTDAYLTEAEKGQLAAAVPLGASAPNRDSAPEAATRSTCRPRRGGGRRRLLR